MDPGKRTFYLGRYNCIEQLGTGPIGETYRAKIYGVAGFEKQFAVKRLFPQLSEDEAFVARFVQAASAFAALEHPGIARVHEVNAQGAHYYIVVDLVRGLDLRRLLDLLQQRGEALAADVAMTLAVEVAHALEYAHSKKNILPGGVLHLGLTAPSVMVTYEGDIKLIDVGLLAALMRPGWSDDDALTATLAYLAPEQWRGESVDARADVFSLGVVLHELLGGGRAFLSDRAAELRKAIEGGPPAPPPADPRLQQIVTRALAPDPAQRFGSIEEMRTSIQTLLGGRSERARTDLSALVRRLASPRERRTGAFAAVTLPPEATGMTSPVMATKPEVPGAPHAWAPPALRPPTGAVLSSIPVHNTLAGIGPDDQALVPIELMELPGLPTEKAMPTVSADDAATNRVRRADPEAVTPLPTFAEGSTQAGAATTVPGEPDSATAASATTQASPTTPASPATPASLATAATARGAPNGEAAAEASWTPPVVAPPPPSPEPMFAAPAVDRPAPVEPAKSTVPGVRLPPARRGGTRPLLGGVAVLAAVGALAIYAGLSGTDRPIANATRGAALQPTTIATAVLDAGRRDDLASVAAAARELPPPAAHTPAMAPTVSAGNTAATRAAVAAPPLSGAATAATRVTPSPAPVAAPTPTPAAGPRFTVTSTPSGAALFVDGEDQGTTPAQIAAAPGAHTLVLLGEGQKLVKRQVELGAGGRFDVTLEPAKLSSPIAGDAGLKVRCKSHGEVRIFVDGEDSGRGCPNEERINVASGAHKIGLFSARTGETHELEREVTEGNNSTRVYVKY